MSVEHDAIFNEFKEDYDSRETVEMNLADYLNLCKRDKKAYATAHERLLAAIGEPEVIDTRNDPRLSRIFQNKTITRFPAFADFYGAEETIMQIVAFLRSAAQGLEERKQILYLLGPVGGGKSSIADRLKQLMEKQPLYALAVKRNGKLEVSPVLDSPLALFDVNKHGKRLQSAYGIDPVHLKTVLSPWAVKRLDEFKGDISQFHVVKVWPSMVRQIGISKTEPGDENNQDVSSLVGKVDIRKLDEMEEKDPDAYSYSGGLCMGNNGLMEFVEMFKAPLKALNPLLEATQSGHFKGTQQGLGVIPFTGIIVAHSNESEWLSFRNNKKNEAFLDRVKIVKVPYCLRVLEEEKIYEKLIRESFLAGAPCAPATMKMLAEFSVLTRLREPADGSSVVSKMRIYDGENLKNKDPKAKSYAEYKDAAGNDEGMAGSSTRAAFKVLSEVFNFNAASGGEVAANPVHLLYVLEQTVKGSDLPEDEKKKRLGFIKGVLAPEYKVFIDKEIRSAYLESYSEYGQNLFDRYVTYADAWIQDQDYRDPDTGAMFDRAALAAELEKIEKPAGVANPKDFRNEVVNFVLRQRAARGGKNPSWTSYEKIREVIEKKMFTSSEDLLPVISFDAKQSDEMKKKHDSFVDRMVARGYTKPQVQLVCDWYLRNRLG